MGVHGGVAGVDGAGLGPGVLGSSHVAWVSTAALTAASTALKATQRVAPGEAKPFRRSADATNGGEAEVDAVGLEPCVLVISRMAWASTAAWLESTGPASSRTCWAAAALRGSSRRC
jgi:hypothetical protein